jgi:hypothetical protein
MKMLQATYSFALLAVLLAAAAGCNPEGPGATGDVSLGADVEATGSKTLEIRAAPDADPAFNPASPRFPSEKSGSLWEASANISEIKFPYTYEIGETFATSDKERYRIVAWLSAAGGGEAPASGEMYGTATFALAPCGEAIDDYCGVTHEVDVTIELKAP